MTLDPKSLETWRAGSHATEQTARELEATFPSSNDVGTYPGHGEVYDRERGTLKGIANHGQYAIDRMTASALTSKGKAEGDRIAAWVWANRKRLGVRYVIWNQRIISVTRDGKWHAYVNPVASRRNTASGKHTNHVHISRFCDADYSAGTGSPAHVPKLGDLDYVPAKPHVFYLDRQQVGVHDSDSVVLLQRKLKLTPSGTFGDAELAAVKAWQVKVGNDPRFCDGVLGPNDAAALFGRGVKIEQES